MSGWNTNMGNDTFVHRYNGHPSVHIDVTEQEQETEEGLISEFMLKFGRDLVQDVRDGATDPIIGRDKEIYQVIRILSRKTKNNPILIGEPGCVLPETKIKIRLKRVDGKHRLKVY